jgi:hypothetical protein
MFLDDNFTVFKHQVYKEIYVSYDIQVHLHTSSNNLTDMWKIYKLPCR